MTDKEKILAFVDKLLEKYPKNYYLLIVAEFIDSLPEEPVSSVWHDASEHPEIDRTFLLVAPNGNSSLCLWGGKRLHSVTLGGGHCLLCKGDKWAYIEDLLHKKEEPVSENLEEAAWLYADKKAHLDKAVFTPNALEKERTRLSFDWYDIRETFKAGAKWQKTHLWKDAQGDDLPEYEREVVVFTQNFPDDAGMMMVAIGHRPTPEGYDGKSLATGEVEHYTPKTYDKGGWNIPDVKYWLDCYLPKEIEV